MLSSPRLSTLALALLVSGCYSGLDLDGDGLTGISGSATEVSGPGSSSTGAPELTDGGGSATDSGGSMSASTAEPGETTDDATSEPAATTGGATTDPTTDPTLGTTTDPGTTSTTDPGTTSTTDSGTTSTTDPGTTSTTGDPDVPDGVPYCGPAGMWDAGWKQLEEDILVLVNQVRAQGANCGAKGDFGPAGPLTMDPALRCAARMHSKDMSDRDFFSHTNPDGESPWDRMGKASYGGYTNAGENIAAGSPGAAGTMEQWMTSDGHCANIMNPAFKHIGVGYHPGGQWGHLWTQVFGAK